MRKPKTLENYFDLELRPRRKRSFTLRVTRGVYCGTLLTVRRVTLDANSHLLVHYDVNQSVRNGVVLAADLPPVVRHKLGQYVLAMFKEGMKLAEKEKGNKCLRS